MMHIRDNTVHEIQVAVGYETFSLNHKHVLTLAVLRQLIGEWNTQSLAGTFPFLKIYYLPLLRLLILLRNQLQQQIGRELVHPKIRRQIPHLCQLQQKHWSLRCLR